MEAAVQADGPEPSGAEAPGQQWQPPVGQAAGIAAHEETEWPLADAWAAWPSSAEVEGGASGIAEGQPASIPPLQLLI